MIPDNGKNVIYFNGKHSTEVFACTVQNGLALVESAVEHLPEVTALVPMLAAARESTGPDVRPEHWLSKALQEVLAGDEDCRNMPSMRVVLYGGAPRGGAEDVRPTVPWNSEWQKEVVLWCFTHKVNPDRIAGALKHLPPEDPLSAFEFLAPARARFPNGVRLVDGAYLDAAEELAILRKNAWKEDVTEARVVSRYVQFLNSWGQGRWDILRVQNA